jgi:hypothetical protein
LAGPVGMNGWRGGRATRWALLCDALGLWPVIDGRLRARGKRARRRVRFPVVGTVLTLSVLHEVGIVRTNVLTPVVDPKRS